MTSQEYWTKRARANKLKTIALEENGIKELKKLLKLNLDDVQSKIKAFYDKYGEDVTAKLSAVEMERYKRALKKAVKKYPKDKILRKTLKEDAPKYRIDRLRQLETQLQTQIAATTATQEKVIGATLQDVATMANSLMYKAMQDQLQLQFAMIQSERLNVIVNSTWVGDGMTWSERIWGNREKFGEKLTNILSKNNVQGVSLQKTARELQHATGVNFNDCFRVVRTESAHIDNQVRLENALQAQKDIGERLKFRFDAFIDDRTSKICQDMNGKEFYLDDAVEGENIPPLHPNCRSTFVTFSSGEDIEDEVQLDATPKPNNNLISENEDVIKDVKGYSDFKNIEDAQKFAEKNGVKFADYQNMSIEQANEINKALLGFPKDARPDYITDLKHLKDLGYIPKEKKLKGTYGVTINFFDGIKKDGTYIEIQHMIGINTTSYKNFKAVEKAKKTFNAKVASPNYKFRGTKWQGKIWHFNTQGEATIYHELAHNYANIKGIPDGFETIAKKWFNESNIGQIEKVSEAWAEAYAGYQLKNPELPAYVKDFMKGLKL